MGGIEKRLLILYRKSLLRYETGGGLDYPEEEFLRHWECALVDWCRFQASWGFWGSTEWLQARVRYIIREPGWHEWLREEYHADEECSSIDSHLRGDKEGREQQRDQDTSQTQTSCVSREGRHGLERTTKTCEYEHTCE